MPACSSPHNRIIDHYYTLACHYLFYSGQLDIDLVFSGIRRNKCPPDVFVLDQSYLIWDP